MILLTCACRIVKKITLDFPAGTTKNDYLIATIEDENKLKRYNHDVLVDNTSDVDMQLVAAHVTDDYITYPFAKQVVKGKNAPDDFTAIRYEGLLSTGKGQIMVKPQDDLPDGATVILTIWEI